MVAIVIIGVFFVLFIISKINASSYEKTNLQNNLINLENKNSEITKLLQQKEFEITKLIQQKESEITKLLQHKESEIKRLSQLYEEEIKILKINISNLEGVNLSYKKVLDEIDEATGQNYILLNIDFATVKDGMMFSIEQKKDKILRYIKEVKFYPDLMKKIEETLVEKIQSYKWLAGMMADYLTIAESEYQKALETSTRKNERERAFTIKELKDKQKQLIKENKILWYELEYINTLIPEAEDIMEYDESGEGMDKAGDYLSNFLPKEEYAKLSDREKNERSLDYYLKRKKTNWEIGRDFERYVGYTFEKKGFHVEYYGIEKKLNDLGRDLIVHSNEGIAIVQCKYWSKNKVIHEKHIAQLYGTLVKYKLDHPENKKTVIGIFITHTKISEEARRFADALMIDVWEEWELGEYPLIKCNVNRNNYGAITKIYHLPMDLQYDTVKIRPKEGDFYAFTVAEAEAAGFRRAYPWRHD